MCRSIQERLVVSLAVVVVALALSGAAGATDLSVSTGLTSERLLDQSPLERVVFTRHQTSWAVRPDRGQTIWMAGMSFAQNRPAIRWQESQLSIGSTTAYERLTMFGEISPVSNVTLRFDGLYFPNRPWGGAARMTVRPLDQLQLWVSVGRRDFLPLTAEIRYDGEGGLTDLWIAGSEVGFGARWAISANWEVASEQTVISFDSTSAHEATYLLNPAGICRREQVAVTYRDSKLTLAGSYRRLSYDGNVMGYAEGHRFMHFGIVTAELHTATVRAAWRRAALEIMSLHGDGEAMGVIEAWPFVDGLARFIGERRHLIARAAIDGYRATASLRTDLWRRVSAAWSCSYYHLNPEAEYQTWRPVVFGFGVDDLRHEQLEIKSAQLLRVHVAPDVRIGPLLIRANVAQWIPIKVSRTGTDKEPSTGGAGSGGEGRLPKQSHGWSGLTLGLTVQSGF